MKNNYLTYLTLILLFSCSKESGTTEGTPGEPSALKACFTISTDNISIGQELEITSCSVAAVSFLYDFGSAGSSLKEHPKVVFLEEGDYTIQLTVTDEDRNRDTFSRSVHVNQASETSKYIYPNIVNGFTGFPLSLGIDPLSNRPYYIETSEDLVGLGGSKFNYVELDADFNPTSHYIADKQFNTKIAFLNFRTNGDKNFHFSRTLPDFYGSLEITYNSSWGILGSLNSATKLNYGYLMDAGNVIFYGSQKEGGFYKAAIEKRNASGDIFEVILKGFTMPDALFGAMIKTVNGYIAYGGIFTMNNGAPQITGYKPILVFMDTNFTVTSSMVYEDSVLDTKIGSDDDLDASFHLVQLSNGNLAMYGNGELIVADASGNILKSTYFTGTKNPQALISLGNTFVLSTDGHLRKFDALGNQIKDLAYPGNYMPELIETNNNLFFVAGYGTIDVVEGLGNLPVTKLFYGLLDKELNLINLNP